MTPAVYRAVIDEAHRRGLRVAAHLFYMEDARDLLASGVDFIAHSVRDVQVDPAFVSALRASGRCITPTLMREVSTFVYASTPAFFADSLFLAHANPAWLANLRLPETQRTFRESATAQRYRAALDVAAANLMRMHDAGIPVVLGSDTGPTGRFQGYFELLELERMSGAGMKPIDVILAGTREAARCMGVSRSHGYLEAGKWADFVVLSADPLADVANVRSIVNVYVAGNPVGR
jgi:imidazolonepropionase-like amidohydrolase